MIEIKRSVDNQKVRIIVNDKCLILTDSEYSELLSEIFNLSDPTILSIKENLKLLLDKLTKFDPLAGN